MNKKTYHSLGLSAFTLFLILTIIVKLNYTERPLPVLDPFFQNYIWKLQENSIMMTISTLIADYLGDSRGDVLGLTIIAMLFFVCKEKVSALWLASVVAVAIGGNVGIKLLVGRIRPELHRIPDFSTEAGMSFSSGHTTFVTVLFGGLFLICVQKTHSKLVITLLGLLVLSFVLLTMLSRVLIGVHYPSDTLGGLLWGASILFLSYPTFLKLLTKNKLRIKA